MKFWRRGQEERELDEELRFHMAEEVRLRMDRGEPEESARRAARRDFGNATLAKEITRDMWGWAWEHTLQDLRYAARMLRKGPAFTLVAVTALTLGIGATTAIFSVVNSVLLRPLPFPNADRLVMLWEQQPSGRNNVVQTQNFLDWRQRNHSFDDVAALVQLPMNISGDGEPVQLRGLRITAGFFEILGVSPIIGRTIRPADDEVNSPHVAVLTYGFWQRRFGGRLSAIGQKIVISGYPTEVIGVMGPQFAFPEHVVELFIPMQIDRASAPRDGRNFRTVARLKPGVTLAAAQADMRSMAAQLAKERPRMNAKWSASAVPLLDQTVKDSRTMLLVLLAAVGFVLLLACANVSNLLLMRASSRRREMAVRVALGAGRLRLLRQLMTESLVLAVTGGFGGFLLAYFGVPALLKMLPPGFPLARTGEIAVDYTVLGFTMLVAVGCGLFFGMFPAIQVGRGGVAGGIRQGGRHGTAANRGLRNLLVITEIAVAVLLVIGAGLMLRSFLLLHQTDPGFRVERMVTFRMLLLPAKYGDQARRAGVVEEMLRRVRALPFVTGASSIHLLPLGGMQSGSGYYRLDRPVPAPGAGSAADFSVISDGYFKTMGIPLLAGRDFDIRDRIGSPGVVILNQAAARQIYPGEDPIGKRLNVSWSGPPDSEIVGVVGDIRHNGLNNQPSPTIFLSNAQRPNFLESLVIRTSADPAIAIAAVKEQIRAVDPDQGSADIQTMEQVVAESLARARVQAALLGVFGLVALVLACVGIYAVVSYSVEQRTREVGIRLALGAAPGSILGMVLREGLGLTAAGLVAGLLAAVALTRYLATLLYTVRPTDSLVYASVCAILMASALAGCYFPARRATRVNPITVLRED